SAIFSSAVSASSISGGFRLLRLDLVDERTGHDMTVLRQPLPFDLVVTRRELRIRQLEGRRTAVRREFELALRLARIDHHDGGQIDRSMKSDLDDRWRLFEGRAAGRRGRLHAGVRGCRE